MLSLNTNVFVIREIPVPKHLLLETHPKTAEEGEERAACTVNAAPIKLGSRLKEKGEVKEGGGIVKLGPGTNCKILHHNFLFRLLISTPGMDGGPRKSFVF